MNFSPARKVLSTTAPEPMFFIFVRTKAPPLPGFTCWNSTMRQDVAVDLADVHAVPELVRGNDLGHGASV